MWVVRETRAQAKETLCFTQQTLGTKPWVHELELLTFPLILTVK